MPYQIEYSPEAEAHLHQLKTRHQVMVLDEVDTQLLHQPHVETTNRKPMRPNPVAPWELRIGELRVYYDIEETPVAKVLIRAVGIKEREKIYIGGREIKI